MQPLTSEEIEVATQVLMQQAKELACPVYKRAELDNKESYKLKVVELPEVEISS
jgi:hypothetical protein